MPKTKISEFSSTPANNTDIDSINIAEGCAPSGINDAIRELMSQLKDWQSGTSNDPMVIGSSGSLTLNQGTANGVAYLNGSKVVTSGSALTFDGTNLGVGGAAGNSTNYSTVTARGTSGGIYEFNAGGTLQSYILGNSSELRLQTQSTQAITFNPNGSEQMRLTSTGLGIGTSSPNYPATIYKATFPTLQFINSASGTTGGDGLLIYLNGTTATISNEESGSLTFQTAGTLRATLDSSGNLGLGVTPSAWTTFKVMQLGNFGAIGGVNSTSMNMFANTFYDGAFKYINTSSASRYRMDDGHSWFTAASGTAGNAITFTQAMTLDASGNLGVGTTSPNARLEAISATAGAEVSRFEGNYSSNGTVALATFRRTGGAVASAVRYNDLTGAMEFGTTTNHAQTFITNSSERARIDSSGNLLVGTTTNIRTSKFVVGGAFGGGTGSEINNDSSASWISLAFHTAGTLVGYISNTTSATSYNTTSDQRLKENIAEADSASTLIDALQVRKFDWKADGSHQRYGFVAQELVTVAPEAVHQPEDANEMMAVDYSKLVPMLVKEIQSLRKRLADAGL